MGLACYLWFRSFEILDTYWEGNRAAWRFSTSPELDIAVDQYENGKASVDPKKYWHAVPEFKRMAYDLKG